MKQFNYFTIHTLLVMLINDSNVHFVLLPDLTNCANDAMKLSINVICNGQQEIT